MKKLPVIAIVALALASATAAAQTPAALERSMLRVEHGNYIKVFRALNDCDNIPAATVDVLRHGYVLLNLDELTAKKRQNQGLTRALVGGLAGIPGTLGEAAGMAAHLSSGHYQYVVKDLTPSRKEQRKHVEGQFQEAVKQGWRRGLCSEWAEDLAWSYAPSRGSECAGLSNDPVDQLRASGEFYGQARSTVRAEILRRYRLEDGSMSCQDFADGMADAAWLLDP